MLQTRILDVNGAARVGGRHRGYTIEWGCCLLAGQDELQCAVPLADRWMTAFRPPSYPPGRDSARFSSAFR